MKKLIRIQENKIKLLRNKKSGLRLLEIECDGANSDFAHCGECYFIQLSYSECSEFCWYLKENGGGGYFVKDENTPNNNSNP